MKLCAVLNASAGSLVGKALDETVALVREGFVTTGATIEIRTPEAKDLTATLEKTASENWDAIIIGGGDGTIATAADICAKHDMPLGVLPLGTMNMLARDLTIPLTLREAIPALAEGEIRHIDMASVNGQTFLCNATFGLVPMVGREREAQRGKTLIPTIFGIGRKVWQSVYHWPGFHMQIEYDGHKRQVITRLLTIANNAYADGGNGFLSRTRLDAGKLTMYLSRHRTRLGFMWFSVGLLLRFWQHNKHLEIIEAETITVRSRHRSLVVCADGENKRLPVPLEFKILPGALKVLAPSVPKVQEVSQQKVA
jgi:diacylglycerol kinase family enzyme